MPRFEKGNPGGPGRPKKEIAIPALLREIGQRQVSDQDKRTMLMAALETTFKMAIEGESWAMNFIADRTEGKPIQQIISENEDSLVVEVVEVVESKD